jgi:glycosyltransferase involved in cell wall biosynthesis
MHNDSRSPLDRSCRPIRPPPVVSVVVPCFNEEAGLREFHRRAAATCLETCGSCYELVFIDDGSRDGTWDVIQHLASSSGNVVGLRLMRNYGHQIAASAGLTVAQGERVLLIDADLQDPPELLGPMMQTMDSEDADVVYGKRASRLGETRLKIASAAIFYRLLALLVAVPIPGDSGDFRLMRRRIVDALVAMPESPRFIRGMVCMIGGHHVPLRYERQPRLVGHSSYPLTKMVQLALDAITGFSILPLRLATCLGALSALGALFLLGFTVLTWAMGRTVAGWSSIMAAIVFFGAVQLFVLGILGEYVGRLFQDSKRRPLYLVDKITVGNSTFALPADFATLSPNVRREIWETTRSASGHSYPCDETTESGGAAGGLLKHR